MRRKNKEDTLIGKDLESWQLGDTLKGWLCHRIQFRAEHGVWGVTHVTLI